MGEVSFPNNMCWSKNHNSDGKYTLGWKDPFWVRGHSFTRTINRLHYFRITSLNHTCNHYHSWFSVHYKTKQFKYLTHKYTKCIFAVFQLYQLIQISFMKLRIKLYPSPVYYTVQHVSFLVISFCIEIKECLKFSPIFFL